MKQTARRELTRPGLTLVGRLEPPQELIEQALWRWVYADLDQFATELEIAREIYQHCPDLVTAAQMPSHIAAIAEIHPRDLATDDGAEVREKILADPVLAEIVMREREETMADPFQAKIVMDDARKLMRRRMVASA